MELSGHVHAAADLPPERTPVPIEQEDRWAPEAVWMILRRDKCLTTAWVRILGRPARNLLTILSCVFFWRCEYVRACV